MKNQRSLKRNDNIRGHIKYLVLMILLPLIFFCCKNSGSPKEVTQATTSLIESQEVFLQKTLPHFKKSGKLYRKYKKVYARKAVRDEEILTITHDGLETSNTAKEGDFVVKNQTEAQEMYIMSGKKFNQRYRFLNEAERGFSEYRPVGRVIGLELTQAFLTELGLNTEFKFTAPWGEKMAAKKGDYLVCPPSFNEVYRIARKEFFETYKLDENENYD